MQFLGMEYPVGADVVEQFKSMAEPEVRVDAGKVELFDSAEQGTFSGDISFILYKGDHYHVTIDTDWGEKLCVNTQDQWDLGDHVGITIHPDAWQPVLPCENEKGKRTNIM